MTDSIKPPVYIGSSHEAVKRICKALNLGDGIKSLSIDVEAGEAVKVFCTRYLTEEEAASVAGIIEDEFVYGMAEADVEYYVNGAPVEKAE